MLAMAVREKLSMVYTKRHIYIFALLSLVLFHAINNWIWVVSNITLLGWDPLSHLAKTLIYNDILQHINVRTLFSALTWPWNRPPLPFLTTVPFYRLFGISTDVAQMSNCVYLAVLLSSVYGIGRILYDRKVGLFAAFLVSFYPILFGISRLYYVDYPLTSMTALSIYLLLKADGFHNRKWSLLLGVALGLGLLTKWPFISFIGAPLAYVTVRSGALSRLRDISWHDREASSSTQRLLTSPWVHIAGALLLSLAWYLPNWDRLSGFLLGPWLIVASWMLLSGTFYFVSRRPSQGANLLSAVMLGGTIASVWALPNIGFAQRFVRVVYGGVNLVSKELSLLDPAFYGRYVGAMVTEQLSPLYFSALLLACFLLVWGALKRTSVRNAVRGMSDRAWILVLWFVVPLLIYSFSQTWSSRFDIGLLPAAALITAQGLMGLRINWLRSALISLFVICGIGQFVMLSYNGPYWISQRMVFSVPILGEMRLLAHGRFIMPPSTEWTDARYWVGPQVLSSISEEMGGSAELGLLVNDIHLNADTLRYLTLLKFGEIEVRDLGREESGQYVYLQIFSSDYVLLSTDSSRLSDGAAEAVRRVYESPQIFNQVFELREEYEFPDGQVLSLYGKRFPPADEQVQDCYRHLVAGLEPILGERDAIILDPFRQVETFARFYDGYTPVYLLGQENLAEDTLSLERILAGHDRIYAIFRDDDQGRPERSAEGWLNEHAFRTRDEWYGDVRLVLYAAPGDVHAPSIEHSLNTDLGDDITLVGHTLASDVVRPGAILRLTLFWEAGSEVAKDYAVFVHLLDDGGQLLAQRDGEPVGGSRPTTAWITDDIVSDNHGLLIPESLAPGEYRLIVGMYLPATGERLPVLEDQGQTSGDSVFLGVIRVVAESAAARARTTWLR